MECENWNRYWMDVHTCTWKYYNEDGDEVLKIEVDAL